MRISGLMRRAMVLINGIRLGFTDTHFTYAITSIIPGFKVSRSCPCTPAALRVLMQHDRSDMAYAYMRRKMRRVHAEQLAYAQQTRSIFLIFLMHGAPPAPA
jgi:hypothetical protein